MPIYMDRHDVSEDTKAEDLAKIHQEDLKIEHKYLEDIPIGLMAIEKRHFV